MRIVFMGTPEFALASLKALCDAGHDVCGVFTRPDAPKGRGMKLSASPVKTFALENGMPVFQPERLRGGGALEDIKRLAPQLVVVVAYGRVLPPEILAVPLMGCINVHASLLPALRGAAPINWAIVNGYKESGVTTMYMAKELDAGDIILQMATPIGERETAGQLHDRLMQMGALLLLNTVDALARDEVAARPQDHSIATYAPILSKADAQIDCWKTAAQVDALVRGMNPWPGARLGKLIVHRAEPVDGLFEGDPGTILPGGILICAGSTAVRLVEVQAPGSRRMTYEEYARGRRS